MALLDDTILTHIFKPDYLRFTTCCRLKSVSSQFYAHARKYNSSLKVFKFNILDHTDTRKYAKDAIVLPKDKNLAHFRLFNTITILCPNLVKVKRATTANDEILQPDRFNYWLRLTQLVHICFDSFKANHFTISTLNQMPNLKSLKIRTLSIDNEKDVQKLAALPKLNVTRLKNTFINFRHVFRLESLQKLVLFCLYTSKEVAEFNNLVAPRCTNLESLKVLLFFGHSASQEDYREITRLVTLVETLPRFKELVLQVESQVQNVHGLVENCPQRVLKYVRELTVEEVDQEEDIKTCVYQLKGLRKISWECKHFDHKLLFDQLPLLDTVESYSSKTDLNDSVTFWFNSKISRLDCAF